MTPNAERREAAMLNAELRNFTRLSEVLAPKKVLELANDFFSLCAMAITANAGKVLSVQNDMMVAAFATGDRKEYANRALKAAQDLQREFGTLGEQWKKDFGLPAAISAAVTPFAFACPGQPDTPLPRAMLFSTPASPMSRASSK